MKPRFSVIIPTYNCAHYICDAVQSVLNQTLSEFEILVIDDGSTDGTKEKIDTFNDSRLRYFLIPNSGGPARPRNLGIRLASSDWLCFLDADDKWLPDKLFRCAECIKDGVDVIYHDMYIIDDASQDKPSRIRSTRQLRRPVLRDLLVRGNALANSSVVIRKSLLTQVDLFDERKEIIASEDYHAWLKVSTITDNFYYIRSPLGYYRLHTSSISSLRSARRLYTVLNEFESKLSRRDRIKAYSEVNYIVGREYLKTGEFEVARYLLGLVLFSGTFLSRMFSFYFILKMMIFKRKYFGGRDAVHFNRLTHDKICRNYEALHGEIFNPIEQERLRGELASALSRIRVSSGRRLQALDFGCGTGNMTRHLTQLGCDVIAADLSLRSLERISLNSYPTNVTTLLLNGEDLSNLASSSVDVVTVYSVLHHIPDYRGILVELCRVLRPGGVLYIDHENSLDFWRNEDRYIEFRSEMKRKMKIDFGKYMRFTNYIDWFIRKFVNRRFQREGDIHVFQDDHIEWDHIVGILESNCTGIVRMNSYLLYRRGYDLDLYNYYKNCVNDMTLLVAIKGSSNEHPKVVSS